MHFVGRCTSGRVSKDERPGRWPPCFETGFALLGMTGLGVPRYTFSSFCRQRITFSSGGIGVSGKLVFQSVTPTSPT